MFIYESRKDGAKAIPVRSKVSQLIELMGSAEQYNAKTPVKNAQSPLEDVKCLRKHLHRALGANLRYERLHDRTSSGQSKSLAWAGQSSVDSHIYFWKSLIDIRSSLQSLTTTMYCILAAALAAALSARITMATSTCNTTALNTTSSYYSITTYGTTIAQIANETDRGICDIGRANHMADVAIIPNIGQSIYIPAQVCEPDHTTCILPRQKATRDCIYGGPRLYYTVNGDTLEYIALHRLNITVDTLVNGQGDMGTINATELLEPGQYVKIPQCENTQCIMQPYQFTSGVYKDLAEKYETTVGQIMMLSPVSYCAYSVWVL